MTNKRLLTPVKLHLLYTADYIEKFGWYKGDLFDIHFDADGRYREEDDAPIKQSYTKLMPRACVLGAMRMVTHGDEGLYIEVARVFGDFVDFPVADWNDEDGRLSREVIEKLRECAMSQEE